LARRREGYPTAATSPPNDADQPSPIDECEGVVIDDDTTGQTGVSRLCSTRWLPAEAARSIRTIRANFIEARGALALHQQAGYTDAHLFLSRRARGLAKREETIYG
jgi:hypothetical protein